MELEADAEPKPESSLFSARGFLALSTFSKVVAVLFAICLYLLLKALLGVGHTAASCGVYAHDNRVVRPDSAPPSGLNTKDFGSPAADEKLGGAGGDERTRVWLERVEETYGYQYDWRIGEYEIDDDDEDHYNDEYEYEDLLDQA